MSNIHSVERLLGLKNQVLGVFRPSDRLSESGADVHYFRMYKVIQLWVKGTGFVRWGLTSDPIYMHRLHPDKECG